MNADATGPSAMDDAPQHLLALEAANRVRLARAELKRKVADGEVSVAEVVLDCPVWAATMPIFDILLAQHRWGRTRCRKLLVAAQLSETKTLGTLTQRQRHMLTEVMALAGVRVPVLN